MKTPPKLPRSIHLTLSAGLALCGLILLLSILILRPHWGLMDDASIIFNSLPQIDKSMDTVGFARSLWDYGKNDIAWGMLRLTYPFMMKLIYLPGMATQPWVSFLWTALLSMLILAGLARFFGRLLGLPWLVILAVNAGYFYQYDLFQHPSLQEKTMLFFGLALCWAASMQPGKAKLPLVFAFAILGFVSKASFVIYFVPGYLIFSAHELRVLLRKGQVSWIAWALFTGLGIFAVLGLGMIATRPGTYTAAYSLSRVLPNLKSPHFHILFWPLVFSAVLFFRRGKECLLCLEEAAPFAGVAAFLLVFMPWGINAYVQALVGPLFAAMIAQILWRVFPERPRYLLVLAAMGLGLVVCAYRAPTMFLRLRDLGQIVQTWPEIGKGETLLSMPCWEGADSVRWYLRGAGATGLDVKYKDGMPPSGRSIWLFDNSLCPFPGRVMDPPGCQQEVRFSSVWQKSFRVVVFQCGA